MALTGLQIQKLLPKTNCKDCGSNTCLAFAMKLAAKKIDLSACPHASDEAKQVLGAAAEAPVKAITLGPDGGISLGEETVFYRHEKTFVNQTALAIAIQADDPGAKACIAEVAAYRMERVGEELGLEMIQLSQGTADQAAFLACAEAACAAGLGLVLRSDSIADLAAAAQALAGKRCLLAGVNAQNAEQLTQLAKDHGHALAINAENLDALAELAAQIKNSGFNDLILEFTTHSLSERFQTNSIARAAALTDQFKALGYPFLHCVDSENLLDACVDAVSEICKFGGICVLPVFDKALIAALLTLRQNIYTDPQKPIQVEPKLYPVGEPDANSPVFLTTNFSLTYFIVSGEIENAGCNAWLLVPECQGMSVLTAWAAGNFGGATIGKFAREIDLENQISSRTLVIPGYVAQISGELEEAMPGWTILVGPQEAGDLESFVKARSLI